MSKLSNSQRAKQQVVTYSALAVGQSSKPPEPPATTPREIPRNVSHEEYYYRWGYLPPGFEVTLSNGKVVKGGCTAWRAFADQRGYPQEPPPGASRQEEIAWQAFLNKTYRPWLNGDEPIQNHLYYGAYDAEMYQRRKERAGG